MPLRPLPTCVLICSSLLAATAGAADPMPPIGGFTPTHAAAEHQLEEAFQALPSADQAREWHRQFTLEPHPAASAANNRLADVVADAWRAQGWEQVTLRHYEVLHSSPRQVSLEMIAPIEYHATLREDPVAVDPATSNPAVSGAYFGYSASGDVRGELVYAHSGNPEDYALLRQHGISVRGKIVIVRYSNPYSYRGFKALTAEREGAKALLIYSDPAEDGASKGPTFPDGPWGPPSHIQRGAITYDFIVPGDPTTPGWASVAGARHIPAAAARSLPKIIALPLSARDAQPLLEHMDGEQVGPEWRGGLPITYRYTGSVQVHVHADMDTSLRTYTVVEARIQGAERPDEWVLVGNHRDAWTYGGVDPVSGTASMLELTRSLGALKAQGIRPRRTIVACSWDGEEYALTGSTEWGEQFADELGHKLVAYLNVDESVAGAATTAGPDGLSFAPAAVASLAPMLLEVARDVPAPSGRPLLEAWRATWARDHQAAATSDEELVDTRVGSGSDHTVFLNHLGRPIIGLSFQGDYGVYHSGYDDHYWMEHIGDPTFAYHTALTRIWGVTALRLANADIVPFDFEANATALQHFLTDLESRAPTAMPITAPLHARLGALADAARALQTGTRADLAAGRANPRQLQYLNDRLRAVESNWLDPAGIPGRPWFRHLLYAARYTYAHLEFPGLTEAIECGDTTAMRTQTAVLEAAVRRNTRYLQTTLSGWQQRR